MKYLLPPTVVIVDIALPLSVKADIVRPLSTENSESNSESDGEHFLLSQVGSGHPVIQREHR